MKTVYYNGNIITMASPMKADGVLTENGRILALGQPELLRSSVPEARLFDLQGHTLMPAFIDAHSHFTQVAMGFAQVSLSGVDSDAEIERRIKKHIAENNIRPGEWIQAKDYDNNLMPSGENPSLSRLDAMAPDNPLVIQHKSGHMGLFNSKALELAGIVPGTPDPEGGHIGDDENELTGYLEENAYFNAAKTVPMPGPDKLLALFERAQQEYLSHGIATVQEGMLVMEMLPLYELLIDSDILKIDLNVYPDVQTFYPAKEKFPQSFKKYHRHVKIAGVKIFLDGSPQGKTAWMQTPYAGEKDYCGYGTLSDAQVKEAMELAAQNQVQLLAHCNGDAAAEQFLRCLEDSEREYPVLRTLSPVMIHAQFLRPDQMERMKKLGAAASFFAAHVYHWGDVHIKNFGFDRAKSISAAASAIKYGLPFTFHQDAPVISPDMLETVWCAVNRITKGGVLLGEDEKISAADALRAVTISAAGQYGEKAEKGSIALDKRADFVVLDSDPLSVQPDEIREIRVLKTILAG